MANARVTVGRIVAWLLVLASPGLLARAAIGPDLSYVNQHSTQYRRFQAFVDQAVAGDPDYGFSATDAAYMFRLTGQPRYGKLAVALVEAQVRAAEAAMAAGKEPAIADDSYLGVGPMLQDLALTYNWCGALLEPAQKARWKAYADQAVVNVWHQHLARWGGHWHPGSGWAVDDPGNNYFYSFLQATMYWALASDNAQLKTFLQDDRLPLLTAYFAALPKGGTREGTSYGASLRTLFGLYRLWRDATGVDLANANSHLTDTIYYWVHATVPSMDQFAPIGDQPRVSMPVLYDYERQLMLEARVLTNDRAAANVASWWLHRISIDRMSNGFNDRFDLLPAGDGGAAPGELVYHATGAGQLFARTDWGKKAMWLDFTAGRYDQSHAHQAQGAFTLFAGDWLAVTENIWTRSGIRQESTTNNVVRFERHGVVVPQVAPTTSTMTVTATGPGGEVHAVADLTPAFGGNPAVRAWRRAIDFRDRRLTVHDTFTVGADTQAVFQVNLPVRPHVEGNTLTAGRLKMTVLAPLNATFKLIDWAEADPDCTAGWRVDVRGPGNQFVVQLGTD
jgi:hypothetical protein